MELMDIYGSYSIDKEEPEEDERWFGRVLVNERGEFEGVVEDFPKTKKFFVFGIYTRESINVTRCVAGDEELPRRYDGLKEDRRYYGTVEMITDDNNFVIGTSRVSIIPAENNREVTTYETDPLKQEMMKMRKGLGSTSMTLYRDFYHQKVEKAPYQKK